MSDRTYHAGSTRGGGPNLLGSTLRRIVLLGGLLLGTACSGSDPLETRTFELKRLNGDNAAVLIEPYVTAENGTVSASFDALTVRERPERLDQIAAVLDEFDTPTRTVLLSFYLIRANGGGSLSEELSDVETELREVLRFDGYSEIGSAVIRTDEMSMGSRQAIGADDGSEYTIRADIVSVEEVDGAHHLSSRLALTQYGDEVLESSVTLVEGRWLVLGTAVDRTGDGEALILVVRPEFVDR